MGFYLIIFSILFSLSFFKSKIPFYFSAGLLIFIAGSRTVDVGTDTYTYFVIFNDAQHDFNKLEIGWYILNIFCGSICDDFNFLLFVVSALTITGVCIVLKKETQNVQIGLCLYYVMCFATSMNVMRQFLAITIVYMGLYFLSKNKIGKFIFSVILASLFHVSALFTLVVLIWRKIDLNLKVISALIPIAAILGLLMNDHIMRLISFNYFSYIESGGRNSYKEDLNLISICISITVFILTYFLCRKNEKDAFWLKLCFFNLLLGCILFKIQLGGRIHYYFTISSIIIYSRYFLVKSAQWYLIPIFILVLVRFVRNLMYWSSIDTITVIPYRSIFF